MAAAFSLASLMALAATSARALDVPPLAGHVNDTAGLLDEGQRAQLEARLDAYEHQSGGHQFVLLTVPTLAGDPIEDFSIRVVEAWKLGRAKRDDGLLLLVAAQDHKMRVEVGYGLEGDITDAQSKRILARTLAPAFRRGDYAGGLGAAFEQLMHAATPDGSAPREPDEESGLGVVYPWIVWPLAILFLIVHAMFFPRRNRPWDGARRGSSRGGYGGWGGFGDGGGGGFSGGGGGFGGGGASGGW